MKKIIKILLWCISVVLAILAIVFCCFFVGGVSVQKNIAWGVDFSQSQTEYLNLNWKEVYSAIINDLGAKNIKLHTNWNWVENKKDEFYFSDIDWQIKQAEENNVKILYVIGLKTGRWPECHIPDWAQNLSEDQQQSELLNYIMQVILRYKDSKAIAFWQVENEPLFKFGECPAWYYKNDDFLKKEVSLVKSLDPSRQILISESGEQSMWLGAAKIGDIVGITMYRDAWVHITDTFGFNISFPLNPTFYSRKAGIIKKLFNKNVIGIELQAEPWMSKPLMETTVDEQLKSMNPEILEQNIEYAKETGLDKFYLWGVEWWYWLKTEKNNPDTWNEAKILFNKN